ncbi:MAG: DNA adenine methylase [Ktedonobacterales bacterium]|nr:DNA adenine methylase [Ktedonobacterales bacterium]
MVALPLHERPTPIRGQLKAPAPYFGGKQKLVQHLLPLVPRHEVYVELFGGMASLLFAKDPAELEVYNDLDSALVNFFRVLRHRGDCAELVRMLDLSPYSKEEYLDARLHWNDTDDPIEKAHRFYIAAYQAFSGHFGRSGWKLVTKGGEHNPAHSFRSAIEMFSLFSQRIRHVQIDHDTFARIIRAYDAEDVFFYADPPYVAETRKDGFYRHEMSMGQHAELLHLLTTCKGKVILSGYDHPLYREALGDWQLIQVATFAQSAGKTRKTGLKGTGAMKDQARTECIWVKPNTIQPPTNYSLWGEA